MIAKEPGSCFSLYPNQPQHPVESAARLLQLLAQLLQHGMQYSRVLRALRLCGFGGVLRGRQHNPQRIAHGWRPGVRPHTAKHQQQNYPTKTSK